MGIERSNMKRTGTLKQWRMFAGLTREDLADRIKKSEKTIQNWEEGKSQPDANDIKELEQVLNIKWAEVILMPKPLH